MKEIFVSTDIEADGPIPGPNSMLSFGFVAFDLSDPENPLETLSLTEELDIAGDVLWSSLLGGYVLRINGMQTVSRAK